jgi:hypothetical protein
MAFSINAAGKTGHPQTKILKCVLILHCTQKSIQTELKTEV